MRIIVTADLHGYLPRIPPCDLLLIAGDVAPWTDHRLSYQRYWLEHVFAAWIMGPRCLAERVIFVAGNHDFALELGGPGRQLRRAATYLQDNACEVAGLVVYGTPWTPELGQWAFGLPEEAKGPDLRQAFAHIPGNVDILLTHAAPMGYGDMTVDGRRVGSAALLERLETVQPGLAVYGHIHEGYGRYRHRGIELVNASHVDQAYQPMQPPLVVMT